MSRWLIILKSTELICLKESDFDFSTGFGIRNPAGRGYFKRVISVTAPARIENAGSDSVCFDPVDKAILKKQILPRLIYLRT
jgi:hypothetical protein